jgi:ferric-chelate reductase
VLESHPLTIANAPPATTCLTYSGAGVAPEGTIVLGARVKGAWTRALNEYAKDQRIVWEEVTVREKAKGKKDIEKGQADEEEIVDACPDCGPVPEGKGDGEEEEVLEWAGAPAQVSLCGPYGGCSIDLGAYETVLLIAGGSGITFTLGLLDDIVGRCVRRAREYGERTRRIQFVWCVRSFGEYSLSLCYRTSF